MNRPRNRLQQHLSELAAEPGSPATPVLPADGPRKSSAPVAEPKTRILEEDINPARNVFVGVSIALACSFLLALQVSLLMMLGHHLLEGRDLAPNWLIWFSAVQAVLISSIVIERSLPRSRQLAARRKVGYWLIAFLFCVPLTALLAYLQLIVVWAVVDWFNLFVHEMPLVDRWVVALCTIGPATLGSVILGLCAFIVSRLTARSKFIEVSQEGLTIGPLCDPMKSFDSSRCRFVRWEWIERIDTVGIGGSKHLQIETVTGPVFRISWKDLLYCYEPVALLAVIHAKAPDALKDSTFRNQTKSDSASYTELWLRYFSHSSQRVRRNQLVPGDKLCDGGYEVIGLLGAGGQGSAYLAGVLKKERFSKTEDGSAGMPPEVVLKEYILPMHRGERTMASPAGILAREGRLLQSLNHEGVVKLFDSFVEDGRGYLVLEYVDGTTLKDLIAEQGPLSSQEVVRIALQVCCILEYLHGLVPPIVHRDLTPDNLMMSADLQVKLVDFNVAWQMNSAVTALAGKQRYIPVEQIRGKPDTRSDIYALGSTMFYLLTAHEPEPLGQSIPCDFAESVAPTLSEIVAKATNFNVEDRFQSAAQMRRALEICR